MADHNTDRDEATDTAGRILGGTRAGTFMQTRFQRIPDAHLNRETVAGIRDMNMGRVRADGTRVGAPTIRFDTGANSGSSPHINIDPRGRPSARNPHVQVPEGVVESARVINKTLKYVGVGLTVAAVAIDAWRLGSAIADDIRIQNNADEIIEELEDAIKKLRKALETENDSTERRNIRETIEHLENVLKDVKRAKKVPVKTIKTGSSIALGWGAGAAGGYGGAMAGAQAGATIGAFCGGPAGVVIGGPIGAVVGAIGGGIGLGMAGSATGEALAEKAMETWVDD